VGAGRLPEGECGENVLSGGSSNLTTPFSVRLYGPLPSPMEGKSSGETG